MDIDEIARAVQSAEVMWSGDQASKWAGMSLEGVGPGTATVSMTIAKDHTNGHGTAHGGVLYMLAGTAFAIACNSHNQKAVAQGGSIDYLSPAEVGDELLANASEVSRQGKSGVYDVTVKKTDGTVVALFRGKSRTIPGQHYDENSAG